MFVRTRALPALGIVLINGTPGLIAGHPDGMRALMAVGALAAIGTAGALVLFNQLIAWTNAVVAASVTYIIPIFAALWGWWDGEVLTYQQLLAGASILLGVWITKKPHRISELNPVRAGVEKLRSFLYLCSPSFGNKYKNHVCNRRDRRAPVQGRERPTGVRQPIGR